jgi:hypothetical protein
MSQADDLLAAIESMLSGVTTSYSTASKAYDVYEAYVFALVVEMATDCGASVHYRTVGGSRASVLRFRTAPGQLYSNSQEFTHAVLDFPGAPPLEVHLGVRVQGTSGVLHECDVVVLTAAEADLSRVNAIAPRGNQCLLAIECKFYVAGLGIGLARNFEGLHADLRAKHEIFVANTDGASVVKYLSSRKRAYERNVAPSTPQATYLKGHVREAFKTYLSTHAPSALI